MWVGVDIHCCLMTVLFVWWVSPAEPWLADVAGNCCGGRLGFMLGWAVSGCPLLPLFLFPSYPFALSPSLYSLIALFELGME